MIRFCSSGTDRGPDLDAEVAARDHDRVRLGEDRRRARRPPRPSRSSRSPRACEPRLLDQRAQVADVGGRADERQARRSRRPSASASSRSPMSFGVSDGIGSGTPGRLTPLCELTDAADDDRAAGPARPRPPRRAAGRGRRRSGRRCPAASTSPITAGEIGRSPSLDDPSAAMTTSSPRSSVLDVGRSPRRSFGPCRSATSARGRPASGGGHRAAAACGAVLLGR